MLKRSIFLLFIFFSSSSFSATDSIPLLFSKIVVFDESEKMLLSTYPNASSCGFYGDETAATMRSVFFKGFLDMCYSDSIKAEVKLKYEKMSNLESLEKNFANSNVIYFIKVSELDWLQNDQEAIPTQDNFDVSNGNDFRQTYR